MMVMFMMTDPYGGDVHDDPYDGDVHDDPYGGDGHNDLYIGEATGTQPIDVTVADPLHGAFSTSQTSATAPVIHVNNAPMLAPGAKLLPILEDTPTSNNNWQIS